MSKFVRGLLFNPVSYLSAVLLGVILKAAAFAIEGALLSIARFAGVPDTLAMLNIGRRAEKAKNDWGCQGRGMIEREFRKRNLSAEWWEAAHPGVYADDIGSPSRGPTAAGLSASGSLSAMALLLARSH